MFEPHATVWAEEPDGSAWFSLLLQPFLMIMGSAALIGLYFLNFDLGWRAFHALWLINAMCYIFVTTLALLIDTQTGRRTWVEAILYAGLVNVIVIVAAVVTAPMHGLALDLFSAAGLRLTSWWVHGAILFIYLWQAGSMAVAWLAKVVEPWPFGRVAATSASAGAVQPGDLGRVAVRAGRGAEGGPGASGGSRSCARPCLPVHPNAAPASRYRVSAR